MRVKTKIIKALFMTQLTNKIMSFRTLDKKSGEAESHRGSVLK